VSDLKKRTGRPPISEELKDLVVELYKTDMKCEDIARKCNISKTSLFKIVKERR
jgi:helix-turn-helix domain of resolvase